MKQVLMCPPTYFNVTYDINPWMTANVNHVNNQDAVDQWNVLYAMIRSAAQIRLVPPIPNLPDMVFTANAGFQFNNKNIILSRFRHPERQGEEGYFADWFEANGYTVHRTKNYFEGQGDLLRDGHSRLWMGTGFRTDLGAADEVETLVDQWVEPLELVDPRWYHLDTCFCPLPNGELLWYPGAFSRQSQDLIRSRFDTTIDVCEEDALTFCCNSVCIMNNVFTPVCSDLVTTMLDKFGYDHKMFDLSEFIKAGGSAKCLVMDLDELR